VKKWVVIGLLAFGAYSLWHKASWQSEDGAFDERGNPIARVFIAPGCGSMCEQVTELLEGRHIDYDVVDISSPQGQEYRVRAFPLTMVGSRQVRGADRPQLISALAENFGDQVLTRTERIVMANHFDDRGRPVILMYGTEWCPYCEKQRAYFDDNAIEYYEIDVEGSDNGRLAYKVLQGRGYPLTYVGYRRFDGYQPDAIVQALRELRADG
jgi:glutaredoxin